MTETLTVTRTARTRGDLRSKLRDSAGSYFQSTKYQLVSLAVNATVKANGYGGTETTYHGTAVYEATTEEPEP